MTNTLSNVQILLNSINEFEFTTTNDIGLFNTLLGSIVAYLQKLQSNFTIVDLQNFMYIITFLRFLLYSIFYDVKTGFFISCISFLAAKLWYSHIIYLLTGYSGLYTGATVPHTLWLSYISQEKQKSLLRGYKPSLVIFDFIRTCFGNNGNFYRIDPISMIFSSLPDNIKEYSDRIYYTVWNTLGPATFKIIRDNAFVNKMSFSYLLIVRFYKKRCPYLIRWHWTCVLLFSVLTPLIGPIPYRLEQFAQLTLLPQNRLFEYFLVEMTIETLVLTHLIFILLALFHALLGQYFYIPFMTENVEIHIGKRPKNSLYSGGYTAWQDYDIFLNIHKDPKLKNDSFFPRFWWGWFGRGDQPKTPKKRQRKKWKMFKFLRKILKNLFNIFQ